MSIEVNYVDIDSIKPYENNARSHGTEDVKSIVASIQEFGFNDPIGVWNDTIVEGHGRWLAAKELKMDQVPILRLDHLTDEQRKAYGLAHNKTAELSSWDFNMVEAELKDISDIDMSLFGFDMAAVEEETTEEIEEDNFDVELPEKPTSKLGDIYILGEHKLICGDCTDPLVIEKLMGGHKADMVFTDPPYGMKKQNEGVENDNLNYDDLLEFNRQWIPLTLDALKDTGCWYCWGIDEPLMDIYSEILKPLKRENKVVIRNYITWAKHVAQGIDSDMYLSYPKETEKCWFVMKGQDWNNNNAEFFNTEYEQILEYMQSEAQKANIQSKDIERVCGVQMYGHWFTKSQFQIMPQKHYLKLQEAYPDCFKKTYAELRQMFDESTLDIKKPYFNNTATDRVGDIGLTDVWRFPVTSLKEREGLNHATPKPIALCARGIQTSSKEREIVLDVFGGSGSTMIACEQTKRRCFMCEIQPKYVDVIIHRWEKYTGKKAIRYDENTMEE